MCSSLLSSFGCLSLRTTLPETTLYNNTAALFDRAGVVISVCPRMPVLWLQRAPSAAPFVVADIACSSIFPRAQYAVPGTGIACRFICLRTCYALSDTDKVYGVRAFSYAVSAKLL
eukprot:2881398-Rhodomonas_salina.2